MTRNSRCAPSPEAMRCQNVMVVLQTGEGIGGVWFAREEVRLLHVKNGSWPCAVQWPGAESNCRHADFQSAALPTELPGRIMQQKNLAGSGGRWQWECLPLAPREPASRQPLRVPLRR